jgi:transposase
MPSGRRSNKRPYGKPHAEYDADRALGGGPRIESGPGGEKFYVATPRPNDKLYVCPECRSRNVIRKGKRIRLVQTLPIGFHPVCLEVAVPRCQCNNCEHIFEIVPPFAQRTRTIPKR